MNIPGSEPLAWSRGRWWSAIVFVMAAQTGLIFWLSERKPVDPRRPDSATAFHLIADASPGSAIGEWLDLDDPTLVALPDLRGFSGPAWMRAPEYRHGSRDWTEPQHWLSLPVAELGATFAELIRTNVVGPGALADKPAPALSEVALSPVPLPARSTYRLEGDLATRELLTPLEVPSRPHTELLTNTVVQLSVNPLGMVFSPIVLSGSGSKEADQCALDLARSLRFMPLARTGAASPRPPTALTWGRMVFQWHTLEMPATNSPPVRPPP